VEGATRTDQQAAAWLARREGPDWGPQDQAALEAWLAERTEHRVAWLRVESAWAEAARLRALAAGLPRGQVPPRGHWDEWLAGELPPAAVAETAPPRDWAGLRFSPRPAPRPRPAWLPAVAALLVLAAGLVAALPLLRPAPPAQVYATVLGQVHSHRLEDGSRLVLASDSQVRVRLERRQRQVELLRGEAIFEVAPDPARPFVVQAGQRRAVAVGTRYAVRRSGQEVRVVVTEGRVRLEDQVPGHAPALLGAGSVATAGPDGLRLQVLPEGSAQRLLEWTDGFLAFDDVPLAEAAAEFNRFNARRLELADPAVAGLRIGGNFRWDNLDGFVGLLEQGFGVRAERQPGRIVLHLDGDAGARAR